MFIEAMNKINIQLGQKAKINKIVFLGEKIFKDKRLKEVIEFLEVQDKSILFIDEIHTIIGAGSASGGSLDVSNLLKPALGKGSLRCIGSTTFQEFRGIFNQNQALSRRFQKIDINEPDIDDSIAVSYTHLTLPTIVSV